MPQRKPDDAAAVSVFNQIRYFHANKHKLAFLRRQREQLARRAIFKQIRADALAGKRDHIGAGARACPKRTKGTKLSVLDAIRIRARLQPSAASELVFTPAVTQSQLASEYGCSVATIWKIKHKVDRWSSLP